MPSSQTIGGTTFYKPDAPAAMPYIDRLSALEVAVAAIQANAVLPGAYTVDTLPDPSANVDKYAIVTDLFGEKRDKVLSSKVGGLSFWQPVRPVYVKALLYTADLTIEPLKSGSIIQVRGDNIGVGIVAKLTLGMVTAYPGAVMEFFFTGTVLGTINIVGVGLAAAVNLPSNGYRKFGCELVNGSLTWKQVQ